MVLVYTGFVVGYVVVLALTERSAQRYVKRVS